MDKLRIFEAFSGIGCQRIALRNIGINFESVGIMEVDKNALLAYDSIHNNQEFVNKISKEDMLKEINNRHIGYNFSTGKSELPKNETDIRKLYNAHIRSKNYGDIRLIDPKEIPDFDLFTYSPPCKNISVAGKQEGFDKDGDTQSSLIWYCENIIKIKRPKYLMFENVKNIVGKSHKHNFDEWCNILEGYGYINHWKILNGCDFGVPQNRERCIMISVLKEHDKGIDLPNGNNKRLVIKDILEKCDDEYIITKLNKKDDIKDYLLNINESNLNMLNEIIKYNRLMQIGLINKKGNESTRRVYGYNGLCPTLNSMNGGNRQPKIIIMDNNEYIIKKLNPLECWRVQGLSDGDFMKAKCIGKLCNSKLYERAGRSIPIPMLEDVFKVYLEDYIDEKNYKSTINKIQSRESGIVI